MSITDGVKNVVASRAAQAASRAISGGLLKVSGNLPGDFRSKMNNPTGGPSGILEQKTRFTTKNLAYPLNVEGDPQQGHFIMFMINEQNPAKLKATKINATPKTVVKKIAKEASIDMAEESYAFSPVAGIGRSAVLGKFISANQIEGADHRQFGPTGAGKAKTRSLQLQNQATTRLDTAISLYMPPSVKVNYGMDYAEADIGAFAMMSAAAIKAFQGAEGNTTAKLQAAVGAMEKGAGVALEEAFKKTLDTVASGAKALLEISEGKIIAPRMEIMFKGVGRRTFSYDFTFIPKSVQESRVVDEIVYAFKFHMHPEYETEAASATHLRFPSTFDIQYMYQNGPNNFLNKISTCFLKTMDVEYGADRFTAYEPTEGRQGSGPPPQKTKISLTFAEMEIITKDRITEGY